MVFLMRAIDDAYGSLRTVRALPMSPAEVDALAEEFEPRPAEDVLAWAVDRFAGRIVLTCSWQQQSSVLLDMCSRLGADIRVVELDTGLLFPETYATRDALIARYGVTVERVDPLRTVAEQAEDEGPELWAREPDRCCGLRKVEPLERALTGMDAWVTGIRRAQSPTRAGARKVQLDARRGVVKIQPLVDWDDERVKGYLFAHDVPYNPLHDQGYPSIGCVPCTRRVAEGEDARAGRWAGTGKTECGLHL
ncbi:MAG: phosphoadenylyl-sulfate reductase [Thermoleophilia bacterium]|nr:phosphoadenylyl-sulfate reductase [Thermoleophilia bacterium]